MQQYRKNLGKVSLTAEGAWNRTKDYEILSIVYDENTNHGFISRRDVPAGVDLYNKEYWMPFNVSGYADNNMILLSQKTNESAIESYTLEEAIKTVASVGRRPGAILGFYNANSDRLDIGGRWEIWQYNGIDIADWENLNSWDNIYYNYNKFVGWYRDAESLKKYVPFPEVGCYAYVGNQLYEATIYRCHKKFEWSDTKQEAWDYVKVIVSGNVTVGNNGNWFNNGKDTGIPAVGPAGKTPIIELRNGNSIDLSFDGEHWDTIVPLSDITPKIHITHKNIDAAELPSVNNIGDEFNVELEFNLPESPDIKVGNVVTSTSGSAAKVTNSGTNKHAVFDFTLPRGVQGAPGQKGDGWQLKGWVDTVDQLPSTGVIGDTYMVGTVEPYAVYMYKNNTSKFVNIGSAIEIKASIFDGGRADTLYGGAREINCGGADAYLN